MNHSSHCFRRCCSLLHCHSLWKHEPCSLHTVSFHQPNFHTQFVSPYNTYQCQFRYILHINSEWLLEQMSNLQTSSRTHWNLLKKKLLLQEHYISFIIKLFYYAFLIFVLLLEFIYIYSFYKIYSLHV